MKLQKKNIFFLCLLLAAFAMNVSPILHYHKHAQEHEKGSGHQHSSNECDACILLSQAIDTIDYQEFVPFIEVSEIQLDVVFQSVYSSQNQYVTQGRAPPFC